MEFDHETFRKKNSLTKWLLKFCEIKVKERYQYSKVASLKERVFFFSLKFHDVSLRAIERKEWREI